MYELTQEAVYPVYLSRQIDNQPEYTVCQVLIKAFELEVSGSLAKHVDIKVDGKQAFVRSGCQPERTIQTGIGEILSYTAG